MNILLADDDKTSRILLARILEGAGNNTVVTACDGEDAWRLLRGPQRFDVAILDVMMPRLDGIDLLERIRVTPSLRGLPIILCTAANDRPTVEKASLLSVSHYIVKPYTKATVLEKLDLVAAELGTQAHAEDVQLVAQRLGVSVAEFADLSGAFLNDVRDWLQQARAAHQPAEFRALAVAANGLKGACLNLGLRQLGHELDAVEATFTHRYTAQHCQLFPPTPGEVNAVVEHIAAELDVVERALAATA